MTPILSMLEQLAAEGGVFSMHYCVHSADRPAFLERIRKGGFASSAHVHFDDGDAAQRADLARLLGDPHPGLHAYVCDPKGFIDAVVAAAGLRDWSQERIHREFFGASRGRRGGPMDPPRMLK